MSVGHSVQKRSEGKSALMHAATTARVQSAAVVGGTVLCGVGAVGNIDQAHRKVSRAAPTIVVARQA